MKTIDHTFPWEQFRNEDKSIDLVKAYAYISGGYRSLYLEGFQYPIHSRQIAAFILYQAVKETNTILP